MGNECVQRPTAIAEKAQEIILSMRRYLETALRDAQGAGQLPPGDPASEGALAQARLHDDLEVLRRLPVTGMALVRSAHAPAPPSR